MLILTFESNKMLNYLLRVGLILICSIWNEGWLIDVSEHKYIVKIIVKSRCFNQVIL